MYMEYQFKQSSNTVCMQTKCMYCKGVKMGYEPPLDDDIALGKDTEDDSDVYTEPDRMWDDE